MPRLSLFLAFVVALVFCFGTSVGAQVNTYNVRQYGAVGDGVTDDSGAIAKATTALNEDPSGGRLYFPAGTYLIGASMTTPNSAYVTLDTSKPNRPLTVSGDSVDTSILKVDINQANALAFTTNSQTAMRQDQVEVSNLQFAFLPVNVSDAYYGAIDAATTYTLTVNTITINSQVGAAGITLRAPTMGAEIENVNVVNGGSFLTLMDGVIETTVVRCSVQGSTILQTGIQPPIGIDIQGSATGTVVSESTFINMTNGIQTEGGAGGPIGTKSVDVMQTKFIDFVNAGIYITDNTTLLVMDSLFQRASEAPVYDRANGIDIGVDQDQDPQPQQMLLQSTTVFRSTFAHCDTGIGCRAGQLFVNASTFTNNYDFSVMYIIDDDTAAAMQAASGLSTVQIPFNITFSSFNDGNYGTDITGFAPVVIITDNTCTGSATGINSECDILCDLQRNTGCTLPPQAKETIALQ